MYFKIIYFIFVFKVIIEPREMFWRQMGGHLRKVETCSEGITWGLGYDNTPYVYTGGWGGAFLKGNCLLSNCYFYFFIIDPLFDCLNKLDRYFYTIVKF